MKLKEKVVVVTGAGRGIGKHLAISFASQCMKVVLVSRTLHEIKTTQKSIESKNGCAITIKADVSKHHDVEQIVHKTIKKYGTIDALVNNAGIITPIGNISEVNINEWINTININLVGTYLCTKLMVPFMIQKQRGSIINISGGGGGAFPNFSAYAVSKMAVNSLTETIAEELKPHNIRVNAIAPGPVNTRIQEQVLSSSLKAGDRGLEVAKKTSLTGGTDLDKISSLALFLMSEKSEGLTGKIISAVHDDWKEFSTDVPEIQASILFNFRRMDPFTFNQILSSGVTEKKWFV